MSTAQKPESYSASDSELEKLKQKIAELELENHRLKTGLSTLSGSDEQLFLSEASSTLGASIDYELTLQNLARLVVPRLADWCTIDVIGENGQIQSIGIAHASPEKQALVEELARRYWKEFVTPEQILPRIQRSGQSILISTFPPDIFDNPAYSEAHRQLLKKLGTYSGMFVPLKAREQVLGDIMLISSGSQRTYTRADLALAEELAWRASHAIDNARLYRAAQLARRTSEKAAASTTRLQNVTAALSGAKTASEVTDIVITQVAEALGAAAGTLLLLKQDGQSLEIVATTGDINFSKELFPDISLASDLPSVQVVKSGRAIWIEDVNRDNWFERFPELKDAQKRLNRNAYAFLPLQLEDRSLGAIALSFNAAHSFEPEEQELALSLAQQCASALERVKLYEEERAARQEVERARLRLSFLAQASQVLAGSLDYATTLQNVANLAVPAIADWCSVYIPGLEAGAEIEQVAIAHRDPSLVQLAIELRKRYPLYPGSPGGLPDVLQSGQPALVPEITDEVLVKGAEDEWHLSVIRRLGLSSTMMVPMKASGQILGGLVFVAASPERHFNHSDLEMAQELAIRAATAIENARLYQAAQNAIEDREEFLSVAAHELKTPLTSLKGFAQLLKRQLDRNQLPEPERLRRSLAMIDEQSDKLAELVGKLLDVSRIDAGRLKLELKETDITALLRLIRNQAQARTDKHQLILIVPEKALWARVDALRFEQVVNNLVDNAIKYSPQGGPVTLELSQPSSEWIRLAVTDQGLGISPEKRNYIFDRFYQAHEKSYQSGMGLGLYISRQIVELHGGKIAVEFPENGGTRFVVQLPL